ncbi:MAG TPA: hypothetical protein VMB25_15960 [Bryobacteraceae bacterium]|nr:hypothetical protein [Bryobacteraceae bacterium]
MSETVANIQAVSAEAVEPTEHKHLLANRLVHEDGFGPAIDLGPVRAQALAIHLEVDQIMQHQALCLSVWGSGDGVDWGPAPLLSLPPKHYCGNYIVPLDLSQHPEVRYLRASWKACSWGPRGAATLFGFSVVLEPADFRRREWDRSRRAATAAPAFR